MIAVHPAPHAPAIRLLALLCLILALSGCTRHIIHQRTDTSRDYTYIEFSRSKAPYTHQGQVGGEHTTFIKVLGFEGDRFAVEMQQQGDVGFTVYGEGVRIARNMSAYSVNVDAPETFMTVEISALSYGEYILTISKE